MSFSVVEFLWKSPGDFRLGEHCFPDRSHHKSNFLTEKRPSCFPHGGECFLVSIPAFQKALKFMPMHISTSELQTSYSPLTRWRSTQTSILTREMPCQSQCLHLLLLLGSSLRVSKIFKSMEPKLLFVVLLFTFTQNGN